MNKTAAIIVTYNRIDMLRQCVEHVQQQSVTCDIVVIDNASTDGTAEYIQQIQDDSIHYYNTGENLGGAGGFHYGICEAVKLGYEYIWIMDDDCLPEAHALSFLLRADDALHGNYGWLSSKCYWTDGTLCQMNLQRKTPYKDIKNFTQEFIPAQMASFVSLFLRADTVKQYGLPIKEFFIWTDDWEYTRRISRALPCYVVNSSHVVHAMQNRTIVNIATDSIERLPRYQYFYRNDVYLYRREGIKGWIWLLAKDVWHSVQIIMHKKDIAKKLKIVWGSAWKGVSFQPEIEYCQKDSAKQ